MDTAPKYIGRDELTAALDRLCGKLEVWVPVASGEGKRVVRFRPYRPGMVPELERRAALGPKQALLAQVEPLLSFRQEKDGEDPGRKNLQLDEPAPAKPSLIFGARPCDARGFLVFDRVFTTGPYVDGLYEARRRETLIAALVCGDEDAACFCSSVGGGPVDMEGSDLRITPIGGGFVVEALNERALPVMELLEKSATRRDLEAAGKVQEEAAARKVGRFVPEHGSFLRRFEELDYWREMAEQCLSCGICTFVCPTCYCFSITDEMKGATGERIRSWDSCMFPAYTLEASGHNPRPTRLERYRNRIGHKFDYFPEKYEGMIACCGCGRCIRSCPVSIDIRKVVENLGAKDECPAQR